jgi:hypothetical protein
MKGSLTVEAASPGGVATSTLLGLVVMAGEQMKPVKGSLAADVTGGVVSFTARVSFASTTRVVSEECNVVYAGGCRGERH